MVRFDGRTVSYEWSDLDELALGYAWEEPHELVYPLDLRVLWEDDVVAVVDSRAKKTSSRDGHRRAPTSARFAARLSELGARLDVVRRAIAERPER